MIIGKSTIDAARARATRLSKSTLNRKRNLDFIPQKDRRAGPVTSGKRSRFLSAGGATPTEVEFERLLGTNDLVDEFFLERALLAAIPVCRISIGAPGGGERGCATGFMISPRLLLTNHHVFQTREEAAPSVAEFNFRLDVAGNPEPSFRYALRPADFFATSKELDFTVVAVEPVSIRDSVPLARFGYLRLIAESGKAQLKEWMNIIQHPGGARRQFAMRDNQCIDDTDPDVMWYMSDTSQGSSGAPVFNDSFQVVALHHAGVPRTNNQGHFILKSGKTTMRIDDKDDSEIDWVANAGIRISRICSVLNSFDDATGHIAEWKEAVKSGDILTRAMADPSSVQSLNSTNMNSPFIPGAAGTRIALGTLVLELNAGAIPFAVSPAGAVSSAAVPSIENTGGASEAAKIPIIHPHLETRTGFNTKFLGRSTPLPKVKKPAVAAPLKAGGTLLHYEHFSLVMHKERRLAIFTASNVDGRPAKRKPEPGFKYTRAGLTGLGENDTEKWANDPRLDDAFQLPDKFYTKDNGAFDKGHVVRREDVCWGDSFAEVQRGNGDTFHVTNCSPQRGNFNQSSKHGIWGKLENFIGAQADTELFCIFAGPVLAADDELFPGKDLSGAVKVAIPKKFWKVVCALKEKKLQVFAFLLEQDLTGLPLEFQVNAEWKEKMVSLKKLEQTVKLLTFQKLYHNADQGK
ncbi:MAG TPA: DNA/RNA non-specific endonuclease [Opitutaceae bacterium]|nr:DNA/RNA non-specific endonuclease [Opitutaceae bacterium]